MCFGSQLKHDNRISLSAVAGDVPADLMPISLHSLVDANVLGLRDNGFYVVGDQVQYSFSRSSLKGGGRQRRKLVRRQHLLCWLILQLMTLNRMYLASLTFSRTETFTKQAEPVLLSDVQIMAVKRMFRKLDIHFNDPVSLLDAAGSATLSSILDRIDIGERYGEKVYKAENLVAERVQLPPPGEAGVVPIESVLYQQESWLENPGELIKDGHVKAKRTKVWAADDEWDKICAANLESGLFEFVDEKDIFRDSDGDCVFCGAFGVPKTGNRQRFIIVVGMNECIDWDKLGDEYRDPRLPYPTSLTLLALREGEVLLTFSEDERNCFYIYRLPPAWKRYLAFAKRYQGRRVALSCVPMGFILSVGILQQIQRCLCALGGLDESREITPGKPFPDCRVQSSYQVYIDNFDEFLICDEEHIDEFEGKVGELQGKIVAEKKKWNIPLNDEKRLCGARSFAVLGAQYDGETNVIGVDRRKRQLVALAILFAIFSGTFSYAEMASVFGVTNHCFLYNRLLFAIFGDSFRWLENFRGGRWLPPNVFAELFAAAILLPFAENDLSKPFDASLRSSDASLWGGAFGSAPCPKVQLENLLRHCDCRGTYIRVDQRETSNNTTGRPTLSSGVRQSKHKSLLVVPGDDERDDDADLAFSCELQWKWRFSQPIVLLEGLAFATEIKHLTRRLDMHHKRLFHLFDAQSALGGFCKGRSSSVRLNRICRRVTSMSLVASLTTYFGWTDSESQPLDHASRVFPLEQRVFSRNFARGML